MNSKINTLKKIKNWQSAGRVIVFTNGCFDILHRGHITYLQKAKQLGEKLVVGLNSDASVQKLKGQSRPVQNQRDRKAILEALSCVDAVLIFDELTPLKLIQTIKPKILVKGGDYKNENIIGADFIRAYGGKVVTIPLVRGNSTTRIVSRILSGKALD